MKKLREDTRPIHALSLASGCPMRIGQDGVTRIVPYWDEGGIRYAVYQDEWLAFRVNDAHVEYVYYEDERSLDWSQVVAVTLANVE